MLRGLALAAGLSLIFMVVTAYVSAATLLGRVDATDVMRAASGAAWSGRIGRDLAWFVIAQVGLHLALGLAAWTLALASAALHPSARAKFGRTVVGWFSLLAGATIAYNALWFPRTLLGAYYHDILATPVGPLAVGQFIYFAVMAAAAVTLGMAAWILVRRSRPAGRRSVFAMALPLAVLGVASVLWATDRAGDASMAAQKQPNIILLGVDSLRLDELRRFGGAGATPNLDRFLGDADLVRNTTTPAARTFSSWVAILTGRSPPTTGARFNLGERSTVSANPTVADVLRKAGYRTVYSTDEVRFANIDETYGFDQVLTPRIGASDFLIGTYNELPLASVFVNTRIGQLLFPFSYANRGVATTFQPQTYLSRLERELSFDGPTLFIAHLTASHWPYYVSDTPFGVSHKQHPDDHPLYRIGLHTADQMFGEVVTMLDRKGALQNAIVVVLSDHGEALGLPSDSFLQSRALIEGLRAPLKVNDFGHGQSVLSPSQYHVLLAFRTFGPGIVFGTSARELPVTSTVEDISPTILDLLGIPGDPLSATGVSLAPFLRGQAGSQTATPVERVRFTETDLSVLPTPDGGVDEVATARQNSKFFEVDPQTGRLHIARRYAPLAIAFKERAAFASERLLAALPASPDTQQYLLFDTTTGNGRLLLGRPESGDPEAQRLWDALHEHFGAEMKPAVAVTRDDWPRIEQEWGGFLQRQEAKQGQPQSELSAGPPHS